MDIFSLTTPDNCGFCGRERSQCVCKNKKPKPSFVQKTVSFMGSAASHAMNFFQNVDEDTKKHRLEICSGCEFMDEKKDTCLQCGCKLSLKAGWATESCPIGKWGTEVKSVNDLPGCGGCGKKA